MHGATNVKKRSCITEMRCVNNPRNSHTHLLKSINPSQGLCDVQYRKYRKSLNPRSELTVPQPHNATDALYLPSRNSGNKKERASISSSSLLPVELPLFYKLDVVTHIKQELGLFVKMGDGGERQDVGLSSIQNAYKSRFILIYFAECFANNSMTWNKLYSLLQATTVLETSHRGIHTGRMIQRH